MSTDLLPHDTPAGTMSTVVKMGSAGIGNHAQNLHIDGVEINNAATVNKINNVFNMQDDGGDRLAAAREQAKNSLFERVAVGAMHNSDERCDAPKCHPETRIAVQDEIVTWVGGDAADVRRIKWVTGPAGTGKTAIMGSVAETCDGRGELAAAFFFSSFSGSQDRRSKKKFVPTLAYQLHQHPRLQHLRAHILDAIVAEPAVFNMRLKDQVERLILRPLRQASVPPDTALPLAVVIDGLDECDQPQGRTKEGDQTEILEVLLHALSDPSFPFQIVIASRPEPWIRQFFSSSLAQERSSELFLDARYDPSSDIELYLRAKFAEIGRRYKLPPSWVKDDVIRTLVETASGQFIYAATVVRFIDTPTNPPHIQLQFVLGLRREASTRPLADLDTLYAAVLQAGPDPLLAARWIAVSELVTRQETPWNMNGNHLRWLLESYRGETEYLFSKLGALVCLDNVRDGYPVLFTFYHRSFLDFLKDKSRSGDLYLPESDVIKATCDFIIQRLLNKGPLEHLGQEHRDEEEPLYLLFFFRALHTNFSLQPFEPTERHQVLFGRSEAEWWVEKAFVHKHMGGPLVLKTMLSITHSKCPMFRHRSGCVRWRRAVIARATAQPKDFKDMFGFDMPTSFGERHSVLCRLYFEWKWKRLE